MWASIHGVKKFGDIFHVQVCLTFIDLKKHGMKANFVSAQKSPRTILLNSNFKTKWEFR